MNIFLNLAPKLKNIRRVYDKRLDRSENFEFHPSKVFNSWTNNFTKSPPSIKDCEILIMTRKLVKLHNEIKSIESRRVKDKILILNQTT